MFDLGKLNNMYRILCLYCVIYFKFHVYLTGVTNFVVCEDIHKVCEVLRLIQSELTDEVISHFMLELQTLESPIGLAERIVDTVFFQDV